MDERILEQLNNLPYYGEDANQELQDALDVLANAKHISDSERERLNYELEKIKEWGLSKVFLFASEICHLGFGTTIGIENNSYVNYLLGASSVNACLYNLPFERYFNKERKFFPPYNVYVEYGYKGELLKKLYEKYGKSTICRGHDNVCIYYISAKPFRADTIKKSMIIAKNNEEAYEDNISRFTSEELDKLGFFSFGIVEVKDIKYSTQEKFNEDIIYQKAKELFSYKIPDTPSFSEISDVNKILKDTEFKLVYQEQFMEILNKICGYDLSKADYFRRETAKAKRGGLKEVEQILTSKYGEKGQNFFEYLYKYGRYTVSKAYVLATLHAVIDYSDIN